MRMLWLMKLMRRSLPIFLSLFLLMLACCPLAQAAPAPATPTLPIPALNLGVGSATGPQDVALSLQIVALITVLSMAPAILLMLTSFTRILVVLGFIRTALGLQQTPPNQVITSLALFLTFFTMTPVWNQIYNQALTPYLQGTISAENAWDQTLRPLRTFMFKQTREKELSLMIRLSKEETPQNQDDVPVMVLIPAYVLSELKTAFQMGVVLYIPFIVVDMIVASILMSMGMMMLPPSMISLPFKILLFVMADGWNLIVASLVTSFN